MEKNTCMENISVLLLTVLYDKRLEARRLRVTNRLDPDIVCKY